MTQSTTASLSAGVRKIRRALRERHGEHSARFVMSRDVTYPDGIDQQTPGLFGFWFDGYQHMRVVVEFDYVSDELVLTGWARRLGDLMTVEEEMSAAKSEGLTMDVGQYEDLLQYQPRQQRWPAKEVQVLRFEDPWPEGLKLALMRELGLRL